MTTAKVRYSLQRPHMAAFAILQSWASHIPEAIYENLAWSGKYVP